MNQCVKKKIRFLSVVFAFILLTGSLQTDVYAASKRTKACKVYKSFLSKNESDFVVEEGDFLTYNEESYEKSSSFMIVDMDKNGTPELVTYHPKGYKRGYIYIYTYKKGKVTRMKNSKGRYVEIDEFCNAAGYYTTYACKKNHLHITWNGGWQGYHDYVYKVSKGKVKLYLEASEDDLEQTKKFRKNGKKISKKSYSSAVSKCGVLGKSVMVTNNKKNRKKYCK